MGRAARDGENLKIQRVFRAYMKRVAAEKRWSLHQQQERSSHDAGVVCTSVPRNTERERRRWKKRSVRLALMDRFYF